ILGYSVWEQRYSRDSSIIGRVLPVNGLPHTVVGVMPKGFMFPELEQAWMPITPRVEERRAQPWDIATLARRKESVSLDEAKAQLATVSKRLRELDGELFDKWTTTAA